MRRIVDDTTSSHGASPQDATDDEDGATVVGHRNAPDADPACLYGLIGDVARAGSEGTETNAVAIAANFMAYLSCAVRRGVYLPIGNTRHHVRLFYLHIGRSGRGRKGDAVSLVLRIAEGNLAGRGRASGAQNTGSAGPRPRRPARRA